MSEIGAVDRFWLELTSLYEAAGKPTLRRLVLLGLEQRPQLCVSHRPDGTGQPSDSEALLVDAVRLAGARLTTMPPRCPLPQTTEVDVARIASTYETG